LGHRGFQDIKDAGILALAGEPLEPSVHSPGILFGKLGDGADAEQIEIAEHSRANGNEVLKVAVRSHVDAFHISL